jgi:hypothetical protein
MKFVLVNDRAARVSTCANCSTSIGFGYLHEVSFQRFYCDYACYLGKKAKSVPIVSRAGAGIDAKRPFSRLWTWIPLPATRPVRFVPQRRIHIGGGVLDRRAKHHDEDVPKRVSAMKTIRLR